jgi:hypothetical protein
MKKVLILIVLIAVTAIALMTVGATFNKKEKSELKTNSIRGTWQLTLYKYGSGTSIFREPSPNEGHIKLITDSQFMWAAFDKTTKKIYSSAGGTYTLNGDNYTESIDYGLGMDNYLEKQPTYTVKVEGDNLFLSGNLSEDYKIEEVWKRVK